MSIKLRVKLRVVNDTHEFPSSTLKAKCPKIVNNVISFYSLQSVNIEANVPTVIETGVAVDEMDSNSAMLLTGIKDNALNAGLSLVDAPAIINQPGNIEVVVSWSGADDPLNPFKIAVDEKGAKSLILPEHTLIAQGIILNTDLHVSYCCTDSGAECCSFEIPENYDNCYDDPCGCCDDTCDNCFDPEDDLAVVAGNSGAQGVYIENATNFTINIYPNNEQSK